MASCQITGIPNETWRAFRRICLEEGVSANRKLRELIETEARLADGGSYGTAKSRLPKELNRKEENEGKD